jgi:GST-like protein
MREFISDMLDLYFRPTANGHKITIFLEEVALPYRLIAISSIQGGVFAPEFLRISPNNKMPVIVDHAPAGGGAPLAVFESGAILIYLAEKSGRFLATELRTRTTTLQWLMWQMASLGPISGQNGHFRHQALPDSSRYAPERFFRELRRLYAVLDHRLRDHDYLAGEYSIADMACYPWIRTSDAQGIDLGEFQHVAHWMAQIAARPAVQRAYALPHDYGPSPRPKTDEEHQRRYRQTAEMLREAYARMDAEHGAFNKTAISAASRKPTTPV